MQDVPNPLLKQALVLIDDVEHVADAVKKPLLAQCLHTRLGLLAPTSSEVTSSTIDGIPKADLSSVCQTVKDFFKGCSSPPFLDLLKEALRDAKAEAKRAKAQAALQSAATGAPPADEGVAWARG